MKAKVKDFNLVLNIRVAFGSYTEIRGAEVKVLVYNPCQEFCLNSRIISYERYSLHKEK